MMTRAAGFLRRAFTGFAPVVAAEPDWPITNHRFVLIERDDFQGEQAKQKKIYLVDLRRIDAEGFLVNAVGGG